MRRGTMARKKAKARRRRPARVTSRRATLEDIERYSSAQERHRRAWTPSEKAQRAAKLAEAQDAIDRAVRAVATNGFARVVLESELIRGMNDLARKWMAREVRRHSPRRSRATGTQVVQGPERKGPAPKIPWPLLREDLVRHPFS